MWLAQRERGWLYIVEIKCINCKVYGWKVGINIVWSAGFTYKSGIEESSGYYKVLIKSSKENVKLTI